MSVKDLELLVAQLIIGILLELFRRWLNRK